MSLAWTALLELLAGVDEEYVGGLLTLLKHEDADRNARRVEQVWQQPDHGINVTVFQQLAPDEFLHSTAKQRAVWQDNSRHALVL